MWFGYPFAAMGRSAPAWVGKRAASMVPTARRDIIIEYNPIEILPALAPHARTDGDAPQRRPATCGSRATNFTFRPNER